MKELRIAPYQRDASADDLPDAVRAVTALRFGLFPEGVALFRFAGDTSFLKNLQAAKRALTTAFTAERAETVTTWRVKTGGCSVRMDTAHHAALVTALDQASRQGVPSQLVDGFVAASEFLTQAVEVDPNTVAKGKGQ